MYSSGLCSPQNKSCNIYTCLVLAHASQGLEEAIKNYDTIVLHQHVPPVTVTETHSVDANNEKENNANKNSSNVYFKRF